MYLCSPKTTKYKTRRCGMIANETTLHKTKMTQKLTTIGHHTALNQKQSPYRIVAIKGPVKKLNEKTKGLVY